VASHNFDVLKPIKNLFWILFEWKFAKLEFDYIFHSGAMIFYKLLGSYLHFGGYFARPKRVGF